MTTGMISIDLDSRRRSDRRVARGRQAAGFSLIEVLVSVVILTVGILGVAGMQVISLQQNRSALLRAEALQIGNDILDRMRANPTQGYAGIDFDDTPAAVTNCRSSACSASDMKDYDISLWQCTINSTAADESTYPACTALGVAGNLPGGQGAIVDDSDDTLCTVEAGEVCVVVRWVDGRDGSYSNVSLRTRTD